MGSLSLLQRIFPTQELNPGLPHCGSWATREAGKVRSLLFNMLSRLVMAFLPRSKCLLISWLQLPSAVFLEPRKWVSYCSHEVKRCLLLERKVMTNLDSILKNGDIILLTKVCRLLWFFLWSCMDVRIGLWRRLSAEELMLLNCGVGEDSWESLGLQGDQTNQS